MYEDDLAAGRRRRLGDYLDTLYRVRQDCPAAQALERPHRFAGGMLDRLELPRYAAASYDGYDSWVELLDTLDEAARWLAAEAQGEAPYAPAGAVDLDSGRRFASRVSVRLEPLEARS